MSDYINREDAIERLSYHTDFYQNDREFGTEEMLYKDSAINEISELPSADVVEVVRCKDCKHNVGIRDNTEFYDKDIVCDYWESDGLYSTDFCSYGMRADE